MLNRPFQWMNFRSSQGVSQDDRSEYVIDLELADVGGIGLRKEWISIHQTLAAHPPADQKEAELEALVRTRDALDKQIAAIQQSS